MDGVSATDLVVTGGRVVTPHGVRDATVHIGDGRIVSVTDGGRVPDGAGVIDAAGAYVLPGLVDTHVHFRTPGLEYKEDWTHAGRAAVAGGVTTVMDMPNTVPPTLTPDAIAAKAALVGPDSLVDFGLHIGVDPRHPEALADLDPAVTPSAKVFLTGHHTAPTVVRDPAVLERAYRAAAVSGVRMVVHAEDDAVFALLDGWRGAPRCYADYERYRPRTGGIVAVARLVELVGRHDVPTHVLHVSGAEEVDLLCAAGAAGLPLTFEVTAHHLSFTAADGARTGARTRLSPSIRGRADQDRLWEAVGSGQVHTLGSDHAPHTVEEKTRPPADAPPGLPGVQELAVAVWTGMRGRWPAEDPDVAIARLVALYASRPAELFGLSGKGRLVPGADADLVLFDPDRRWLFGAAEVRSKCGWSAYEGWTMTGRVVRTVKAGRTVWDDDGGTFGTPAGGLLTRRREVATA